jgi:hypothetical protein
MKIAGILWPPNVEEKCIVKHRVVPCEVEEVFSNRPKITFSEEGLRKNEDVYLARGQTNAGRYLKVYFIYKRDGSALILSARSMNRQERKSYEQK